MGLFYFKLCLVWEVDSDSRQRGVFYIYIYIYFGVLGGGGYGG